MVGFLNGIDRCSKSHGVLSVQILMEEGVLPYVCTCAHFMPMSKTQACTLCALLFSTRSSKSGLLGCHKFNVHTQNLGIHSVIFDVPYVHIFHRSFGKNEQIACWIFFLWSVHMCTKREKTFPISMYFLSIFSHSVIHRRPLKKKWTPDMLCTCAQKVAVIFRCTL